MSKIMIRNDNPNPKIVKKRLIAQRVMGIALAGTLASGFMSMLVGGSIQDDVNALKDEQTKIYETFKSSPEFESEFKAEVQNITEAYVSGQISYEEFTEKLEELNSNEFLQEVFNQKANTELKQEIAEKDDEITALQKNSNRAKADSVLLGAFIGGATVSMASAIPWTIYSYKETWKEVEEEKTNAEQNKTL